MVKTRHSVIQEEEEDEQDDVFTGKTLNTSEICNNIDIIDNAAGIKNQNDVDEGLYEKRTRRCANNANLKSEDKSGDESDEQGYNERALRHRESRHKVRKCVRISVVPSSGRTSPRRSTLRKPRRYLDSDDDVEAVRVYPLRNRLSSMSEPESTPGKLSSMDSELEEEITYEKLARGHGVSRARRRIRTPMSAPPAVRPGHPRHDRFLHPSGRAQYSDRVMYEHEEPRRSGRQRKLLYDTFNQSLIAMMNHTDDRHHTEESNKDDSMELPSETAEVPPRKKRRREVDPMPEEEMVDLYARVKRTRSQVKRDMYGIPVTDHEKSEEDEEGAEGEAVTSDEETEEEEPKGRSYSLREHRPRTQMLEINWEEGKRKKDAFPSVFRDHTPPPPRRKKKETAIYRSPARRKTNFRRRKAAFHGHSSTSSSGSTSDSDNSDDERRFERRKTKSMAKSRQRCLPMNLNTEDVATGILRDRMKIGASLADIDPMNVDRSVTFDSVGGLGKHIHKLKEMIVFPLLYPEVFERFKIQPPRGVLFYGPPGTGKTLVARALANECSTGEKKVAFFMRKGADCLSKWVGESERQLRLLFDQAYQMRPSIIFFDEIDGLAPVRSSRQDQIHSSIVSTLLALMDGLDNRGEIVVIGATNRLDSIDPALRRPGRFDREFLFPLPTVEARQQILSIHTKAWNPQLAEPFLAELAEKCTGYCGADLKALCTEAALHALRRRYPQIYTSQDKLQLDVTSICVNARDFHHAMQCIVPTAQRSACSPARALIAAVRPLMKVTLERALGALQRSFPSMLAQLASLDAPTSSSNGAGEADELASDSDEDTRDIFVSTTKGRGRKRADGNDAVMGPFLTFTTHAYQRPATHRPRLLLAGEEGQGQSSHVGPAILHSMERLPVHTLDLPTLFAISAKTPEESCAQVFREAKRMSPSIIYMPHVCSWWDVVGDACRSTFITLLKDMEPSTPTLLLATSELPYLELPAQVQELFSMGAGEVMIMQNPTDSERREFFHDLLLNQATKPPSTKRKAAQRMLEQLPKAPPPKPRELTTSEMSRLREHEEATVRELRLFLRDVLNKLGRDRKFQIFAKPVDGEEVPDYYEIITNPMDMSTMMSKIDLCKYETVRDFLKDINLITSNALEYNPDGTLVGRAIRHRACALRDLAQATVEQELDKDFEKQCEEIKKARKNRGESPQKNIPDYYFTKPIKQSALKALRLDPKGLQVIPDSSTGQRDAHTSRRASEDTPQTPLAEDENALDVSQDAVQESMPVLYEQINGVRYQVVKRRERIKRAKLVAYKSPFCKPTKKRFQYVTFYIDPEGREFTHKELFEPKEDNTEDSSQFNTEDLDTQNTEKGTTSESTGKNQKTQNTATTDSQTVEITDDCEAEKTGEKKEVNNEGSQQNQVTLELRIDTDVDKVDSLKNELNSSVDDPDAEKENLPSPKPRKRTLSGSAPAAQGHSPRPQGHSPRPHGHSPRLCTPGHQSPRRSSRSPRGSGRTRSPRSAHGHSPRTRSKSPRGDGQMVTPKSAPEVRNFSPRNRSLRNQSPRTRSAEKSKSTPVITKRKLEEISSDSEFVISRRSRTKNANTAKEAVIDKTSLAEAMESSPMRTSSPLRIDSSAAGDNGPAVNDSPNKCQPTQESTYPKTGDEIKTGQCANGLGAGSVEEMDTEGEANASLVSDANASLVSEANTSFSSRVTRSKRHSSRQAEKAVELLRDEAPKLVLDQNRLDTLLDTVVEKSRGYRVETLERLYSMLSQCIYHHRREHDKTQLLTELETTLENFMKHH